MGGVSLISRPSNPVVLSGEGKQADVGPGPKTEDLDTILSEFGLLEKQRKRCAFGNCRKKVHLMFKTCEFCHHNYCVEHGNPLFHGESCATLYRAKKRAQALNPPPKKLKDDERNYLKIQYKKRLGEVGHEVKGPGDDGKSSRGKKRKGRRKKR